MKLSNLKMKYIGIILVILILFVFFILNHKRNKNTNNVTNNVLKNKEEVKESFVVNENYEDKLNFNKLLISKPIDNSSNSFVDDFDKKDVINTIKINNEKYYLDRILVNLTFQLFCNNFISKNPSLPDAKENTSLDIYRGGLIATKNQNIAVSGYKLTKVNSNEQLVINKNNHVMLTCINEVGQKIKYITKIKTNDSFLLLTDNINVDNNNLMNSSVSLVENVVSIPINIKISKIEKKTQNETIFLNKPSVNFINSKSKVILTYNNNGTIKYLNNEIRDIKTIDNTKNFIELDNTNNNHNLEVVTENNAELSFYSLNKLFKIKSDNGNIVVISGSLKDNYDFKNRLITIKSNSKNLDKFKDHTNKHIYVKIMEDYYVTKVQTDLRTIDTITEDKEIILTEKLHPVKKSYMDTQDVVSLTLSAQDIEIYLLEEVKDNVDIVKSTDLSTKKDNLSLDNIKYGGLNISGINSSNIANKIKQIMNDGKFQNNNNYKLIGRLLTSGQFENIELDFKYDGNNDIKKLNPNQIKTGDLYNINISIEEKFPKNIVNLGSEKCLYNYSFIKTVKEIPDVNDGDDILIKINTKDNVEINDYININDKLYKINQVKDTELTINLKKNSNNDLDLNVDDKVYIIKKSNVAVRKNTTDTGNNVELDKDIPDNHKILYPNSLINSDVKRENVKFAFSGVNSVPNEPILFVPKSNNINDTNKIYESISGMLLFNVLYKTNIIYSLEPNKNVATKTDPITKFKIFKYVVYKNLIGICVIKCDGELISNNLVLNKFITIQLITDYQEKIKDKNINIFNNYIKITDSNGNILYLSNNPQKREQQEFLNSTIVNFNPEEQLSGIVLGHDNNSKIYENVYVSIKDLYFTRLNRGEQGNYRIDRNNKIILSTLNQHLLVNVNRNLSQVDTFSHQVGLPILESNFYRHNFDNNMFSFLQMDKRLESRSVYTNDLYKILTQYDDIYNEKKEANDKFINLEMNFEKEFKKKIEDLNKFLYSLEEKIESIKEDLKFKPLANLDANKKNVINLIINQIKQDNNIKKYQNIQKFIDKIENNLNNYNKIKNLLEQFDSGKIDTTFKNIEENIEKFKIFIEGIQKILTNPQSDIINYIQEASKFQNTTKINIDSLFNDFSKLEVDVKQFMEDNVKYINFKDIDDKIIYYKDLIDFETEINKLQNVNEFKNKNKVLINLIRENSKEIFEVIKRYKTFTTDFYISNDITVSSNKVTITKNNIEYKYFNLFFKGEGYIKEITVTDSTGNTVKDINITVEKGTDKIILGNFNNIKNLTKESKITIIQPEILYKLNTEFILTNKAGDTTDIYSNLKISDTEKKKLFKINFDETLSKITETNTFINDKLDDIKKNINNKEEFQKLQKQYEIINRTRSIRDELTVSLVCKSKATGGDFSIVNMKIKFIGLNNQDFSETYNIEVYKTERNKEFNFVKIIDSKEITLKVNELPIEKTYYNIIIKPIIERELSLDIYHFIIYDLNLNLQQNKGVYYSIINEYIKFNPLLNVLKFDFSNLTLKQLNLSLNLKYKVGESDDGIPRYIIFKDVHNGRNNNKVDVNISTLDELKKKYPEFYAKCILNIMNNIKGKLIKCNGWGFGSSKIKRLTNDNCKNLSSYFQFFEDVTDTTISSLGRTISTKTTVSNIVSTLTYDGNYYPTKEDIQNQFKDNYIKKMYKRAGGDIKVIVFDDPTGLEENMTITNLNIPNLYIVSISRNIILLNKPIKNLKTNTEIQFLKINVYFSDKYKLNNMYPYLYFNNQTDICYLDKNFIERKFNGEFMLTIVNMKNNFDKYFVKDKYIAQTDKAFIKQTQEYISSLISDKLPGGIELYNLVNKEIIDDIERLNTININLFELYNLNINEGTDTVNYEMGASKFKTLADSSTLSESLIKRSIEICKYILDNLKDLYWVNNEHPQGGIYKCNLLPDITKLKVENLFLKESDAKKIYDKLSIEEKKKLTEKEYIKKIKKDNVQIVLSKESVGYVGDQELGSMNEDTGCLNPNLNLTLKRRSDDYYSKWAPPSEHFKGDIIEDFNNIQLMSSSYKGDVDDNNIPKGDKNNIQYIKTQCKTNPNGDNMATSNTGGSCKTKVNNKTICSLEEKLASMTEILGGIVKSIGGDGKDNSIFGSLSNLTTSLTGEKSNLKSWIDKIKTDLADEYALIESSISTSNDKISSLRVDLLGEDGNDKKKGLLNELKSSIEEKLKTITDNQNNVNSALTNINEDINIIKKGVISLDCILDGSCPASSAEEAIFEKVENLEKNIKLQIAQSEKNIKSKINTLVPGITSNIKELLEDEDTLSSLKKAADIIEKDKSKVDNLQKKIDEMKVKIDKIDKQTGAPAESLRQKNIIDKNLENTEKIINKLTEEIGKKNDIVKYIQTIILNPELLEEVTINTNEETGTSLSQIRMRNKKESEQSQIKEINNKLLETLQQISSGYVQVTNKTEADKQLRLMNNMIEVLKKKEGNVDNTSFLQKLLLTTQMQMNNLVNNVKSQKTQPHIHNELQRSMNTPHLPTITQFKPEGTSNIFSPLIDIKTNSKDDNKKFMDAFERGFDKGIEEGGDKSKTTYDMSKTYIDDKDKFESKDIRTGDINKMGISTTIQGYSDSLNSGYYSNNKNTEQNIKKNKEYKEEQEKYSYSQNVNKDNKSKGSNNQKLGIPGYSYLDPKYFNMPQKRAPVCIDTPQGQRGASSLDPAGYMWGGNANVMEFQGVGSILPKFEYKQAQDNIPDKTNRI